MNRMNRPGLLGDTPEQSSAVVRPDCENAGGGSVELLGWCLVTVVVTRTLTGFVPYVDLSDRGHWCRPGWK